MLFFQEMWKNILEPVRPQMTTWRMRVACWILKATNTVGFCNTYSFSTATVVARTRLKVTLHYIHIRTLPVLFISVRAIHFLLP